MFFSGFDEGIVPMRCPNCSVQSPENARFCPQCGMLLEQPPALSSPAPGPMAGWTTLLMTLGLSLLVSFILTAVFNLPIFFLGTVLPFFWLRRGR
jgi:hypothetical protein